LKKQIKKSISLKTKILKEEEQQQKIAPKSKCNNVKILILYFVSQNSPEVTIIKYIKILI